MVFSRLKASIVSKIEEKTEKKTQKELEKAEKLKNDQLAAPKHGSKKRNASSDASRSTASQASEILKPAAFVVEFWPKKGRISRSSAV